MSEKWFRLSEQGAGVKRLLLTKYIYQYLGEFPVRIIAFFAAFFVFISAKEQRRASCRNLKFLNKKFITYSSFLQFLNYANSLVDKFVSCMGKFDPQKFDLSEAEIPNGAFFVTTHVGNVEILRSLFQSDKLEKAARVNVFLQSNACEIFNTFLKALELKLNIDVFPVENINPETSIQISERLGNGEVVFMAGDRISAQNENRTYTADFLQKKVKFPLGTLKFALLLKVPVYFIVCIKEGKKYKVYTEKFVTQKLKRNEKLEDLQKQYVKFLEIYSLKYPLQFYNFFDLFE